MKSIYFDIISTTMAHPHWRKITKLWLEKILMGMRFFTFFISGLTLTKLLPAFLQLSDVRSSKVTFSSNFTCNSFSVSLLCILNASILILTLLFFWIKVFKVFDKNFRFPHNNLLFTKPKKVI